MITGGLGLIGSALASKLQRDGLTCDLYDIAGDVATVGDVCDRSQIVERAKGCTGIVHLAAVSRVVWAQADPGLCWKVNVEGTQNVLAAAMGLPPGERPWVLYASSREVYGEAVHLPVAEDSPLAPLNPYGHSKVEAERLTSAARQEGLVTGIARFSNVYGSVHDHADRVIPAFARAAALGGRLMVEGPGNVFDFTHVDDVIEGIVSYCELLQEKRDCPPIHFVSGEPTTLGQLAEMASALGNRRTEIQFLAPRNFDVAKFYGNPERARSLLGWQAETPLAEGLKALVQAFAMRPSARQILQPQPGEPTAHARQPRQTQPTMIPVDNRGRVVPDRDVT